MPLITLSIFKERDEYRAAILTEGNSRPIIDENLIRRFSAVAGPRPAEMRAVTEQLKEEAKKWAREKGIKHVVNLDDPYK